MFTLTLACKLSNRIAAFASVSGSLPLPLKSNFQPNTAVSVLMINGTVDPLVPYQGSFVARGRRGEVVCVSETIELWRKHISQKSLSLKAFLWICTNTRSQRD